MVVDQVHTADVGRIFHALADSTRRDIVALAVGGRYSVSALAKRYPMSFAAVQKHVAVLEGAGLITKERRGRGQLGHTHGDTAPPGPGVLAGVGGVWGGPGGRGADSLANRGRDAGGEENER